MDNNIKRRKFIYYSSLGALTAIVWPFVSSCNNNAENTKDSKGIPESFEPDIDFELTAVEKISNYYLAT